MTMSSPVLGLEAPRLGAHLEQRDARRVVDPDRRRAEDAGRAREAREVVVAQHALAQPLRVDARLAGEHALHERLLAHLEREERDRHAVSRSPRAARC